MTTHLMLQADALMNAIALLGLAFALGMMPRGPQASPLDKRLRGLYAGMLVILGLRQAFWAFSNAWLVPAIMMAAAWLPLLVLLLVEELLRRHAPRLIKWFVLLGSVISSLAALTLGPVWPQQALALFAAFQLVALFCVIGFIIKDRATDLSPAETRMADSMALALLMCIPLSLTDFRGLLPGEPVMAGSVGLLLFAVMASALVAGMGSPMRFALDLLGFISAAAVITLVTHWLLPTLTFSDLYRLAVTVISVNASTLMVSRLNQARLLGRRRKSISATLAFLPDGATEDMVINAHPVTASGRIIAEEELKLYDGETQNAIAYYRVLNRTTVTDQGLSSAVENLLDEHGATHLVRLSKNPLRLLALASGVIGGTDPVEADLALLSRIVEGTRSC